jgi:hypothetical protein
MQKLKTFLTVIGAVTILVLAANSAVYAATGGKFILGQTNKANKASVLKRTTNGPALNLTTKTSGSAPLSTNGRGRVANLNADLVDGFDSSALKTTAYVFTRNVSVAVTGVNITVPLPAGRYVVSYSAYMLGAANDNIDCYLEQDPASGSSIYSGESSFLASSATPGATGTGYIDQRAAGTVTKLICGATTEWTTFSDEPIQIVATKIDNVAGPTAARVAPGARQAH